MQNRIIEKGKLLDENGNIRDPGYAKEYLL